MRNFTILLLASALTGMAACTGAAPPGCDDSRILGALVDQTSNSSSSTGGVTWSPKNIVTLDWDTQSASLAGIDPLDDVTKLNSCAAVMMPSKDKVWVPGEKLDPRVVQNMEMAQRTADQMCAGNVRVGRTSNPDSSESPLCKRLQDSARELRERNAAIETGGWAELKPQKIRYITGKFDNGQVFAKIILQ